MLAAALKLWRVGSEVRQAWDAAAMVLAHGGSPIVALRKFAAETDGKLDDAAVAELEALMRKGIATLEVCTRLAATAAGKLSDPKVRQGLEKAVDGVISVGWQAGRWRHQLRRWLEE